MMDPQSPTYAFISTTSTTYHPEHPLENVIIDNPGLVRRRRRKTTARELEVLEMAFRECGKPNKETREQIAKKTGMDSKAVQVCRHPTKTVTRIDVNGRFGFRINVSHYDDYPSHVYLLLVPRRPLSQWNQ